jgi:hypothetical protein
MTGEVRRVAHGLRRHRRRRFGRKVPARVRRRHRDQVVAVSMPAMTKTTIAQKNAYHASVVHISHPHRNSLLCNDFRHTLPGVGWFSTADSTMPHESVRGLDYPGQKFDFAVHATVACTAARCPFFSTCIVTTTISRATAWPRPESGVGRRRAGRCLHTYCSRSTRLRILPAGLRGIASAKITFWATCSAPAGCRRTRRFVAR